MKKIPSHQLSEAICVEPIDHPNPYDFNRIHRHTYFEIFLFEKGGGFQIIDFKKEQITDHTCYLVGPGQVHLMQREPTSKGVVIQFNAAYSFDRKFLMPPISENTFQLNGFEFVHKKAIELQLATQNKQDYSFEMVKLQHHLFLLALENNLKHKPQSIQSEWHRFLALLEDKYTDFRKVEEYSRALGVNSKKLNNQSKLHAGTSCLNVIHERLLLEIKRKMLFEEQSTKSIAFDLNFNGLSSFSSFVKRKTGKSPKELRQFLSEIYS